MTMPADPVVAPAAIRARVRAAMERAWADAVAAGRLPALEDPASTPVGRGRAARQRRVRRLRDQPRDEAGPAAPPIAARHRGGTGGGPRGGRGRARLIASAEVARPGFLNLRVADAAYEGLVGGHPRGARRRGAGSRPSTRAAVNVEFVSANPTGPLTVGNARGAFVGDLLCRVLEAGGQAVTREYYFNDSGAQVDHLGASVAGAAARRARPRGRIQGRLRRGPRARGPGRTYGPPPTADGADEAAVVGAWASRAGARHDRGQPRSRARRPLRRLEERGLAPRRGLGRAGRSSGCGTAARSTSRTARPGSGRRRSATTRTGSSTARTAGRRTSPRTSAT